MPLLLGYTSDNSENRKSKIRNEMAECRGLAPLARRHAPVSTGARRFDRLTFQNGPHGRTCTCNLSVLSGTPLHWATRGRTHGRDCTGTVRVLSALSLHWTTWVNWCRVRDFHPQPLRSERSASGSWANAAKNWRSRQDSHLQPRRSKRRTLIF